MTTRSLIDGEWTELADIHALVWIRSIGVSTDWLSGWCCRR